MKQALEAAILDLLHNRGPGKTICPSDAARVVDPTHWRALMDPIRAAAQRLVTQRKIVITQKGKIIDPAQSQRAHPSPFVRVVPLMRISTTLAFAALLCTLAAQGPDAGPHSAAWKDPDRRCERHHRAGPRHQPGKNPGHRFRRRHPDTSPRPPQKSSICTARPPPQDSLTVTPTSPPAGSMSSTPSASGTPPTLKKSNAAYTPQPPS